MARYHANLDLLAHHNHRDVIGPEFPLQVLGVAGVAEAFLVHRPLVDGGGHQHVHLAFLEVFHRHFQALDGRFGAVRGALAGFGVDIVRQAVHQVDLLLLGIGRRANDVDVHRPYVVKGLAIKAHQLGRAVDDGGEAVQDPFVREGFDDDLVSDSVAVALGYSDDQFG